MGFMPSSPMGRPSDSRKTLAIYTGTGSRRCDSVCPLSSAGGAALQESDPRVSHDLMPIFATMPGIGQIREPDRSPWRNLIRICRSQLAPRVQNNARHDSSNRSLCRCGGARRRNANPSLVLPASSHPRVGIVWAGNPNHREDRHRDCLLREFLPILSALGITFYSLQKGNCREDLADLPRTCVWRIWSRSSATLGIWR